MKRLLTLRQRTIWNVWKLHAGRKGGASRRYAGVSHIDVAGLTQEKAKYINEYCKKRDVEISSLAYYPNTLEPNLEKRKAYISHLYKLIDASAMLDVNLITTFIGRDPQKTVTENLEIVKEVWPPIVKYAEEKGVKIAIENCPMLFTEDEWPGGTKPDDLTGKLEEGF